MVPMTLVLRSLVRDVGKELPRDGPVLSMFFKGGLTLSTSGNLPSMHVPGVPSGTTIVPTCSPQYSPLFAPRACDTVETGLISSSERHAKYKTCYM